VARKSIRRRRRGGNGEEIFPLADRTVWEAFELIKGVWFLVHFSVRHDAAIAIVILSVHLTRGPRRNGSAYENMV